jgi:ComF family protein
MGLLDLLFPIACLNCKKEGVYICSSCLNKLPEIETICPVCERASIDGFTHIRCKKKLGLDGLISLWPYEGVVRKGILALKYKFAREVAYEFTKHVIFKLRAGNNHVPIKANLIPIPLYWYRENWRGFNQSELIGGAIADKMGWGFTPNFLIRRKQGRPQTELSGDKRRKNIKNVFSINSIYQLQSTSYILFDDVYTTGSTLKEACKVLKRKGAKEVWGLTIAR